MLSQESCRNVNEDFLNTYFVVLKIHPASHILVWEPMKVTKNVWNAKKRKFYKDKKNSAEK